MAIDTVIRVDGLGKRYRVGAISSSPGGMYRYKSLRDSLGSVIRRPLQAMRSAVVREPMGEDNSFWALRDVGFEVKRGEVVGIIGRNGAGKSTLLKVLSRITKPTAGRVDLFGRVGSLLEVGTGFHPELSGRENIFLNGAILGMTRGEVRSRFDEIVDFSEIERFLDTPVKQYSSGMYTRLAFAVAAHLEPEILIVDEVLSVGDAAFQQKCLGKMQDVATAGRTVLFVSHQMNAVQTLCHRVLLLRAGRLVDDGPPRPMIARYLDINGLSSEWVPDGQGRAAHADPHFAPTRLKLLTSASGDIAGSVGADEPVQILIEGEIETLDSALTVGFKVSAPTGENLFWSYHTDTEQSSWPPLRRGANRLLCTLPPHILNEGEYVVELLASLHNRYWICESGKNAPSVKLIVQGGLSKSPMFMVSRPGLLAPILPFAAV